MTASASGVDVPLRSRAAREAVELVSSMRFAISLLAVICIAAVIGTVVRQQQPYNDYVNQFGPFWAEVYARLGLYAVYSAPWFVAILAVLVVSTSLCIARNAPKIVADLRSLKEDLREQSLEAFHHKAKGVSGEAPDSALARIGALLAAGGWQTRVQRRTGGTMLAARKGASNRLGYLAAHSAIVLICLGGLADGDMVVRLEMLLQGKTPFGGAGTTTEIGAEHRLAAGNPSFRGNLYVPEGTRAGVAVLSLPEGVVLQDLPFDIELKKFTVGYYSTGMPKLFASEIVIHDRASGRARAATVEVNKPVFHDGVAIYQSSFDDGGSQVRLAAMPLVAGVAPFDVEGRVGGQTPLVLTDAGASTLEFTALRVINVENFGDGDAQATDPRKVDLIGSLERHLGSGGKPARSKSLRNIGPSITYRLRDASGQAREYRNYMQPVEFDGQRVFLYGVRDTLQDDFRYLRVPADGEDSAQTWVGLRRALDDPAQRERAAQRYAHAAAPDGRADIEAQLRLTARRVLALFAGAETTRAPAGAAPAAGGLQALSEFMEGAVPEADRARMAEVLLRVLNGSLFELVNLARADAGQAELPRGAETERFMTTAVGALSDSFFYPAPVIFGLKDFRQVQASVFQVARAPGKTLVYLGAGLLIAGVFLMLYVRERRLWVWLQPTAGGTRITAALAQPRRTLDADAEFERLRRALLEDSR